MRNFLFLSSKIGPRPAADWFGASARMASFAGKVRPATCRAVF